MPAEPVSVMLRASNFFVKNPALWVPPSNVSVDSKSQIAYQAPEGRDNWKAQSKL